MIAITVIQKAILLGLGIGALLGVLELIRDWARK